MEFEFPQNDPVFQPIPVEPIQNPPVNPNQDLPITFCIKTRVGAREGYYLMRWSHGGLDANNKIVHVLKPANHHDRFYNISNMARTRRWNEIVSRKNSGTVSRTIRWMFSGSRLTFEDERIPIILITPASTSLPQIKAFSFIPITQPVEQVHPVQQLQPAPNLQLPANIAQMNIPQNTVKKFPITTIPQHIVMALLRDAAMQEEVCPITSEEIDVSNGAVTSCFHLFEKNAIMQWLLMPNSRDKCPVCNTPCNSFTLDNGPPPLDTAT